jgi:hypothetical protein
VTVLLRTCHSSRRSENDLTFESFVCGAGNLLCEEGFNNRSPAPRMKSVLIEGRFAAARGMTVLKIVGLNALNKFQTGRMPTTHRAFPLDLLDNFH